MTITAIAVAYVAVCLLIGRFLSHKWHPDHRDRR